jgi:hypothetical protein
MVLTFIHDFHPAWDCGIRLTQALLLLPAISLLTRHTSKPVFGDKP